MRGLKISTDGTVEAVEVSSLKDYQAIVGGYIELVYLDDGVMYVNEEGKLLDLPYNAIATEVSSLVFDVIMGDALVLGPGDDEGNDTPVTDAQIARVASFTA
jgi:uncharacterized protein DUF3846